MAPQPITWRNINAPDFRAASQLLDSAGRSINQGFNAFENILSDERARKQEGIQLNTQDFLNTLRQDYKDPEALRQAQESGAVNALRSQYASLDPTKSGAGAVDSLVGTLQNQAVANNQYQASQLEAASQPIRDRIAAEIAAGNFEGARNILATTDSAREDLQTNLITQAQRQQAIDERNKVLTGRQDAAYFEGQAEKARAKNVQNLIGNALQKFKTNQDNYLLQENDIKTRMEAAGFDIGALTDPTYIDSLSPERQEFFKGYQEEFAALGAPQDPTKERNVLLKTLIGAKAYPEEALNGLNVWDAIDVAASQPSATSRIEEQSALQQLDNDFGDVPFVRAELAGITSEDQIQTLMDKYKDKIGDLEPDLQQRVFKIFNQALNEGVLYDGKPVRVLPIQLEQMLQSVKDRPFYWNDIEPENVIEAILNSGNNAAMYERYNTYKQLKSAIPASFTARRGLTPGLTRSLVLGQDVEAAQIRTVEKQFKEAADREARLRQQAEEALKRSAEEARKNNYKRQPAGSLGLFPDGTRRN